MQDKLKSRQRSRQTGEISLFAGLLKCADFEAVVPVSYTHLLNHPFDEPKQWEIREVNDIMNHVVTVWNYFSNPRVFPEYGRQKGWERETKATDISNGAEKIPEGFEEMCIRDRPCAICCFIPN